MPYFFRNLVIAGVLFILLFLIIGALVTSLSEEDTDTTTMNASVHVLPGAIRMINNNDFPWYGLIITLDDRYSTRYYFGDPQRPYLRPNSIVEPGELKSTPLLGNFIDKNKNEYESTPYTITVGKVKLEAKTTVDGPYDLKFTISTKNANSTPTPEQLPILSIYDESNQVTNNISVKPHRPEYQAILNFVSQYPQTAFGSYLLPSDAYQEMQAKFNPDTAITLNNQSSLDRWKEQFDVHWPNVDAFGGKMDSIMQDRIIDKEESTSICFALDQWTTQMTTARDYVEEYERVDLETVNKNPGLGNLKEEANRALELLSQVECE